MVDYFDDEFDRGLDDHYSDTTKDVSYLVEWRTSDGVWNLDMVYGDYASAKAYADENRIYSNTFGDEKYIFRIVEEIVEHSVSRSELERY